MAKNSVKKIDRESKAYIKQAHDMVSNAVSSGDDIMIITLGKDGTARTTSAGDNTALLPAIAVCDSLRNESEEVNKVMVSKISDAITQHAQDISMKAAMH